MVYNSDETPIFNGQYLFSKNEPDFNNCPLILQFEEEIERLPIKKGLFN